MGKPHNRFKVKLFSKGVTLANLDSMKKERKEKEESI